MVVVAPDQRQMLLEEKILTAHTVLVRCLALLLRRHRKGTEIHDGSIDSRYSTRFSPTT